jgi:hypothetical protein
LFTADPCLKTLKFLSLNWNSLHLNDLSLFLQNPHSSPVSINLRQFGSVQSLPKILMDSKEWLTTVMSGGLFAKLWAELPDENRIEKIVVMRRQWEDLFMRVCLGDITFAELEPLLYFLGNEEDLSALYCSTLFQPHFSSDVSHGDGILMKVQNTLDTDLLSDSIRPRDDVIISNLSIKMKKFRHIYGILTNVKTIRENLEIVTIWIQNVESIHHLLHRVDEFMHTIGNEMWGKCLLKDVDHFYNLCEFLDANLYAQETEFFRKMMEGKDLLNWLRNQPGDLDFQVSFCFFSNRKTLFKI